MKSKAQSKGFDVTKFKLLWDFVLVRALREETTNNGKLIRPEQYDDKPEFGEVVSVGPGKVLDDGTILPCPVKTGDVVFFGKYSTEQTRVNGQDYFLIRSEDIRATK